MKTMKIIRKFIAFTAIFVGITGWAGDSAPFLLDTTGPLIPAPIEYNSSWIGGDSSAEVVIEADGAEIKRATGEGGFVWSLTTPGKHTLTYTTYIDGVQQEEVYSATVFKDWKYTVEDDKATIIETTQTGDVVIPAEIDGLPVVCLGEGLYNGCEGLTSVTIPDSVNSIGANAFANCINLKDITILKGVTTIGASAFEGCASLREMVIPDSVYSIGVNAFVNCTNLTSVSLPLPFKELVEAGDIFVGCSDDLEVVYRSAEITDVVAKQRFPWNKVGISYNVTGNIGAGLPEWNRPVLMLSALDRTTGSNYVAQVSALSGDTGIEEGIHHIVWDLSAQNLQIKSEDMVFMVIYSERSTEAVAGAERAGEILCLGTAESTKIDSRIEPLVNLISYNSTWIGGEELAEVVIAVDGTEIKRTTGEGEFTWEAAPGKHTLTYTTYIDGVAQEEVYTATVFKDWKYTVEDGKATIIETTQTSGDVVIPSEIDGLPVVCLGEGLYNGCEGLTSVTIPYSVYSIGANAFANCTNLTKVLMPFPFKELVEAGDIFVGCSEDVEIVYRNAEITDVVAKQRYPWNGKIDITYNVTGNIGAGLPEWHRPVLMISALDRSTGSNYVALVSALSGDTGIEEGAHHVVWDLNVQNLQVKSEDMVFTVTYGIPLYYVIDLSSGVNATSYPITYLNDVPAGGWTDEYKTTKLVLRLIESGSFKMNGSYYVTLTKPYYMGVFEVTQKQYELVTGDRPSNFTGDTLPVEKVSRNMIRGDPSTHNWPTVKTVDSNSFVGRLQARTGLNFDLPTEAQWEYACRAGTTTTYYWGDFMDGAYAWYRDNSSSKTHSVGTRTPNAWGLYDMSGNVWELCLDWCGTLSSGVDPEGSFSGPGRVNRGGSWNNSNAVVCSSSYRSNNESSLGSDDRGFRIVRSLSNINSERSTEAVAGAERAGEILCLGMAESTKIDSRILVGSIDVSYNSAWIGGEESAEVVIAADGTEIKRTTGEGEFTWSPTIPGKHTLTYTTYIDGVQQEEVYTATVFKDWRYTVENGEATIIETTQTSGDVVIPSEIDGLPVVCLGEGLYNGCEGLRSVTIPDSVYSIGANAFTNCTNLTNVSLPFPLKGQVEVGDIFVGCSDDLEIVYRKSEITNVVAKQRFPWNGKIDITYNVTGNIGAGLPEWHRPVLMISALDRSTGSNYVALVSALSGDTGIEEGAHHIVWDLNAQNLQIKSEDMVFAVTYGIPLYCVIDLSSGVNATSYPITYFNDVPVGGWTDEYKTTKLVLRLIEPGSFKMNGSYDVTFTKPYYMGVFEVTQKQYELVRGSKPSYWSGDTLPVEDVSWNMIRGDSSTHNWPTVKTVDSNSFVGRLQARTGLNFDLPTEAQWEYACRAGTTTTYYWGVFMGGAYAWYSGNSSSKTHSVGTKTPNAWGLYDMSGNVWEWCLDWYGTLSSGVDPEGSSSGSVRVIRGGSWNDGAGSCTSSYRSNINSSSDSIDFGFRIVRTLSNINSESSTEAVAGAERAGGILCLGTAESTKIDSRNEPFVDSIDISYSSAWIGGDESAEVVIAADGIEIKRTTGEGEFTWSPTTPGNKHTLTYTTYIDGIQQEEVYTAAVFKDWKYTVEYGKAIIIETTKTLGDVTIPLEIDGLSVVGLDEELFNGCEGITSIVIPDSVILSNLKQNDWKLLEDESDDELVVYKSNDINHNGSTYMTLDVEGPLELSFDWKVSSESGYDELKWYLDGVQKSAISGTGSGWRTVISSIPAGEHTIKWEYSKDVIVDNGEDCGWVRLPRILFRMQLPTFEGCTNLTQVTMPSDLVTKMSDMFPDSYNKLTSVTLIGDAAVIPNNAFDGCSSLISFNIPNGVTTIGANAFDGCSSLTEIIIPDSVYSIGANAFANCTNLMKVSMPLPFKELVETGDIFVGCSDDLEIVYRSAEITNVVAMQRYPWNGKVDITYNVTGNIAAGLPEWNRPVLMVSALDRTTGANYVAQVSALSGDAGIEEGEHHIVWDLNAQNLEVKSDDMVFTITYSERSTEAVTGAERAGEILYFGTGESTKIDLRNEPLLDSIDVSYNSAWIGGNASAEVVISANGTEIKRMTGEGEFIWEAAPGKHTLTYTTYIDGVAQEEVYTAIVFKDWKYTLENSKATIIETTQTSGDVIIPSEIDGLTVVGLDERLFKGCTNLTQVTMPADLVTKMSDIFPDSYDKLTSVTLTGDVTEIPDGFFAGCAALESFTIPDSVTKIGANAFAGCASLENVVIPDGVTTIGVRAFEGCEALSKITIPNGVTTIEANAFDGCSSLIEIVIPDSVNKIGENVFKDCTNLKSIKIRLAVEGAAENLPDNVPLTLILENNDQRIPDRLRNCVQKVIFSDGITRIADDFFVDCNNLETIDIPQSVIAIGKNVFNFCSSLNTVNQDGFKLYQGWCLGYEGADNSTLKIPEGVLGVASEAFKGMTSLKSVIFSDSLRFIGADAFAGCTQLAELTLPDNIVEIADGAFRDCTWVQSVKMSSNLERIGSAAFANCAYLPNIVCADGLEEIGVGAFSNCWRMTSVSLPASLDSVGRDAFWNCKNLGGVTVPAHVQPLAEMLSAAYSALSSIVIAEGETELCEGAFEGCAGVSKIDIPEAITNIPARAFKNCAGFDRVALPAGLLSIGDEAFAGCSKVGSLILPESLTSIGAGAFDGWALLDVVTIPDGVTFIGSGAFSGCTAVRQVRMPSNVATVSATFPDAYTEIVRVTVPENSTAIIAGFLDGCVALTAFDIPSGVTAIGDNAFRNCEKLSGIVLPDGLESIGAGAFIGCILIEDLTIPYSVTTIGDNAFGSCANIRSVAISGEAGTLSSLFPNAYQQIVSVTVISGSERLADRIFAGCKSLKNVDIPTSVLEIGEDAFENCTALTSVGIPAGVTVLGKGAFRGCETLAEITLPNGMSVLEDEVFSGCSRLSAITVPESVVEIGNRVFYGCTALHSVKFVGDAPLTGVESYAGVSSSLITYVPYASMGWDGISTSMALPEFWPVGYENTIEWWDPIRFDVTFDWNYESGEAEVIEQVVDTTYILPDVDPTREGAAFAGWWTATDGGARITPASRVMLTTPHTLYAHWRMNTYSVAFDANGGTGAMDPMYLTVNKPAVLTACGFTRFDSDFAGWAIEPEGEVLYRDCAEVSNLTLENDAVVTLYAVWTPRTWTEGDYLNQPGFTFTSEGDEPWVTDAEVSHDGIGSLRSGVIGASAEYPNRTYSTIKTTVVGEGTGSFWWKVHCEEMDSEYGDWFDYAVFTVDGVEIAKIAGDTDWTKVTYSVIGVGEHELIWTFTRDDYDLEGAEWLNAAWLDELVWSPKTVALKFDAGGATGDVPEVILRQEGCTVLLPGSGTLVRGDDIFKGWSDGTTLYIPGSEYTFGSEDETLTAVWEEKVWTLAEAADAVALVMNTGGTADWTVDATTGYTNMVCVKSGAVTSGQESWIETKVNGSGKLTFRWNVMGGAYRNQPFAYAKVEVDGTEVATEYLTDDWEEVVLMIDGDNEHTIRWTYLRTSTRAADGDCAWIDAVSWKAFRIVNSSIVYENLRGATHTNPETYQEGTVVEFTNPSDVEGYTFAGWTPERISADMTGAQTVRANWTANNYTIAYNANGGNGMMEPTLAMYDSAAIVKDNEFVRDGYTFKGWALEESGDVVYVPGQSVMNLTAQADGVITFYAVWERILIAVDEPVAVDNLIYNASEQIGIAEAEGYTLSGVTAATDAGEYSATATLSDGYKWADGSMDDKVVTWSIAKATNEWITEPNISLKSWIEGETAGELIDGVAKFGEVIATINGAAFTELPTAIGSYSIEYKVAETGNYSELTKLVTFEIVEKPNPIPAINPDWGYVVTELGGNKNEVAVVFTNHTEKAMTWSVPVNLENVQFLVVGGGGGGGAGTQGPGGGGGGVVTGKVYSLSKGSVVLAKVGVGGKPGLNNATGGSKGESSYFSVDNVTYVTAYAGGAGRSSRDGGSGGGGSPGYNGGSATQGKVNEDVINLVYDIEKFGCAGGNGFKTSNSNVSGGGGGGALGVGGTPTSKTYGGKGGPGLPCDITGTLLTYGSGGGGSGSSGSSGGDGAGSGGNPASSGKANQGGGGGGGHGYAGDGGNGGSGIVVFRYTIPSYLLPEDAEVLPEVTDDSKVAAALEGSVDSKLVENIKTAAEYAAYREWALNLEGVTPEEVKASLNAWLSYALNTAALIIDAPKEGDVIINVFESVVTEGAFEFTVKIEGIAVGDNAIEANLQKVFEVEGAETLANSGAGFSTDNVEVNTATPESGNVKFTVTPTKGNGELGMGNGNWEKPDSFFFRVKMK